MILDIKKKKIFNILKPYNDRNLNIIKWLELFLLFFFLLISLL